MSEDGRISFMASFPAIQSAITISGDGNGMRIKLDVPETSFAEALYMLRMRRTAFRVTIEPVDNVVENEQSETISRRKIKSRV